MAFSGLKKRKLRILLNMGYNKEIKFKDISTLKEFNKNGYHYTCVKADVENNTYVYKMEHIGEPLPYSQYELVRGIKGKQPSGETFYYYPSDERFGTYGWYICGNEETCQERIASKISELLLNK